MKSTLICFIIIAYHLCVVISEIEFRSDFQHPNSELKWENEQNEEEYALEQFTRYLQEQQRRLQLQQEPEPDFSYSLPVRSLDETPDFAVAPPNPQYYQNTPEEEEDVDDLDFNTENQQENNYRSPLDEDSYFTDQHNQENLQENENIVLKTRMKDQEDLNQKNFREEEILAINRLSHGFPQYGHQPSDVISVQAPLQDDTAGVYIIAVVAGISAAATVGLIAFAIGWYNLQKNVKNASDVEYPAYGVTGPNKDVSPSGDRRLAQSAQMYHYQHQKQQIIAMESRAAATVRHGSLSEAESDEENEEGDYTVYECPGLAPTGEMEVKNPLFQDDPTPASQPAKDTPSLSDQK